LSTRAETVFVNLLFFYTAGIFMAWQEPSLALQYSFGIISLLLLLGLLVINTGYAKFSAYRYKTYTALLFYLLLFCIGAWSCLMHNNFIQPNYFVGKNLSSIKVVVDEAPQWKGKLVRFKARVIYGCRAQTFVPCQGRLLVTLTAGNNQPRSLFYGDALLLPASFTAIEKSQNPSEFDYKAWMAMQNIYHQVFLDQEYALLSGQHQGNPLIAFALRLRQQLVNRLNMLIHDREAFSVAATLILGYRADLSKDTLAAYSKTGTIHALSVSGMHVAIIYIVLVWLLGFMDKKRLFKILKTLLIIGIIWFYALLTGFSPSVLRSAIMLTSYILAKTWHRRTNSYNILAFAAFVLLVNDPFLLYDVGFQLSFLSVFGLIYLQPLLYQLAYFKNKWADKLWQFCAMSMAAQLATFPLSVYYFHQFPVYFLVSNLFIMLPATLMMYLGLSMLLFRLYFLAPLLELIISFTNKGLKWIANLPYATIAAIWWNKTELMLVSCFLILMILAITRQQKKLMLTSFMALLLFRLSVSFHEMQHQRQQKIIVFKLNRNYAIVSLQSTKAILYTDLTPSSSLFLYSVKPCLDQHQITEIQFKKEHPDLKKIKHL
jgi:competence protein ComEC